MATNIELAKAKAKAQAKAEAEAKAETEEKFKKFTGLKKDVEDKRDFKFKSMGRPMTLPSSVDWTSEMSPVKDQGSLGSCVGFAVAAMKEFQEQQEHLKEVAAGKKYTREEDHYDLSESWVYWNSKKIDPWPGEEGTSIRCAMDVLRKIGVPCEKAYPYSDLYEGSPEIWAKMIAKWGLIDSYWRIETLLELKTALIDSPVVIGIPCFREIFSVGSNGVIPYPANPQEIFGGHAICIVGYNDSTQRVKFKNSWSTSWGQNGYGYLPYRYIDDFMWDAWVCKDLAVTQKVFRDRADDELIELTEDMEIKD